MCVIFLYSREQALNDGNLVDVTKTAKEAGLKYPTAMTSTVWDAYVAVPHGVTDQDEVGRLWDILWMLHVQIRRRGPDAPELMFQLYVQNTEEKSELVSLKAICAPGDTLDPVITIMLPEED